jgi:ribosomal protein L27
VRQHGTKYKIGKGVYCSKDYTLHADYDGVVKYYSQGGRKERTFVSVVPLS